MTSLRPLSRVVVVMLALLFACGGDDSPKCIAGSTAECLCNLGVSGVQRCNEKGAFDACDCGNSDATRAGLYGARAGGDDRKLRVLYKKACDGGDVAGCYNLGFLWHEGHGGPKNPAKARALYKMACDGGDAAGCYGVGKMWQYGRGGRKDLAKARAFFERACDGGFTAGCYKLGSMWREGHGGPKDLAKARTFFERACDGGFTMGCSE